MISEIQEITAMYIAQVFSVIVTPFIAGLAVWIGYQQWSTNKATLKEKLFDRRFSLFTETQAFLSEIMREHKFSELSFSNFAGTCQRSRFLFGKEINLYLSDIRSRASRMRMYKEILIDMEVGEERTENVRLMHIELSWLANQLSIIFDKFEPFIGFEKVR